MTKFLRPSHWRRVLGGMTETAASTGAAQDAETTQAARRENAVADRRENDGVDGGLDLNPIIERRAYYLWRNDGCPAGRDIYYWLLAEEEVRVAAARGTLASL